MFEIVNSRKLGTLRELSVWLHGARPLTIGIGSVGGKVECAGAAVKDVLKLSFVYFGAVPTVVAWHPFND
jgi:hypothetical protein